MPRSYEAPACLSARSLTILTTASPSAKSQSNSKFRRIVSRRFSPTPTLIALRILFDKNVPVGVRAFLRTHEVSTVVEMGWPDQLENGELLKIAEQSGFDVMVTSDQNIRYQQNLTGRQLALVVLGSNIWPVVRQYDATITANADAATPGSYAFIEMPLPPKPRNRLRQGG